MAFTKKEKNDMLANYQKWLDESQAMFMLEYSHMTMKDVDSLRAKVREVGGQAHVVKNTLMELAFKDAGIDQNLEGTTLVGIAYQDVPALAKVFSDAVKADAFSLKMGLLNKQKISANQIKELADLPPLPVMRARVLGVIMAPAQQLVRTLNEPGRSLAAVIQARNEQQGGAPAGEEAAEEAPATA